jgi:hypothetical protein
MIRCLGLTGPLAAEGSGSPFCKEDAPPRTPRLRLDEHDLVAATLDRRPKLNLTVAGDVAPPEPAMSQKPPVSFERASFSTPLFPICFLHESRPPPLLVWPPAHYAPILGAGVLPCGLDREVGKAMEYDPKIIAKIEALYEPGETDIYLSDWSYQEAYTEWHGEGLITDAHWEQKWRTITITIALTQERMYMIWWASAFVSGWRGRNVSAFRSIDLANIAAYVWSFNKTKTNKGALTGYTFSFGYVADGQAVTNSIWSEPASAEELMELFRPAIARYTGLAAPVDMAAQLRALQTLVTEGVLTPAEMQRAKELFLGQQPDQRQLMERNLRSLHELRKGGVLNQIEFDIKKQDILATVK